MILAKQLLKAACALTLASPIQGVLAENTADDSSWKNANATVSIIIDDVGHSRRYGKAIVEMDERLTLSILPFTPFSQYFANLGRQAGNEIMLHLPMESMANKLPSDTQLEVSMGRETFSEMLAHNLTAFEGFTGINNHQGSRMMKDAQRLEWLMEDIADENMFFVDSRTVGRSPATHIASRYGIPAVGRDVFLDDSADEAEIKREFDRMIRIALRDGHAVAIGHPRPHTINVLRRELPRLKALNIQVVPVTTTIALVTGQSMVAGLDAKAPTSSFKASSSTASRARKIDTTLSQDWRYDSLSQSSFTSFGGSKLP